MNLPVSFNLSSIYCYDEGDGIGSAEPYVWSIFFKIDGQNIKQTNLVNLTGQATFHFGPGSHGNLPNHDVDPGERVNIPDAIGKWSTTLQPIIIKDTKDNVYNIPGMAGVAVVLLEEDNVSNSGAESGHQALNNYVRDSINSFINGISLLDFANASNPQSKLSELIDALKKKIKDESGGIVSKAIKDRQGVLRNIWSWVNSDDKIGAEIWTFDQDEIVKAHYHKSFSTRWKSEGDWEIFGDVNAPNPCQSQLVAVNQKQAQINSVESTIRNLQSQFAQAPASQKPGIRAEIEEVKQQLPPLQAELKRLQGLLTTCYNRQNIIGSVINTGAIGGAVLTTH